LKCELLFCVFEDIFGPLFEVTNDPDTHPQLAKVLPKITGLDTSPIDLKKIDLPPEDRRYRSQLIY
jgi:hypothetical protein